MKQDPLITFSFLIPGGLPCIFGGFDPPAQKLIRPKDLPLEPASPRSTLATSSADAVWGAYRRSMPFSSPGLSQAEKPPSTLSLTVPMSPISLP